MSGPHLKAEEFQLGPWLVRPSFNQLVLAGEVEQLEPQVMSVLVMLFEHRGSVVSRDTLLEHCWSGLSVCDDVVTRCVSRLRKTLRRDAAGRVAIRTISKRGYCLEVREEGVLPVNAENEPDSSGPSPPPVSVIVSLPPARRHRWPVELTSFTAGIAACLLTVLVLGMQAVPWVETAAAPRPAPEPVVVSSGPDLLIERAPWHELRMEPLPLVPEDLWLSVPASAAGTVGGPERVAERDDAAVEHELKELEQRIEARLTSAAERFAQRFELRASPLRQAAAADACASPPAVAPDGRSVAFIACEEGGGASIAVMDSATRNVRRLEPDFDQLESLAWGAPSTLLVSGSLAGEHALFEVELAEESERLAVALKAAARAVASARTGLFTVGFNNTPPTPVEDVEGNARMPDLSLDGKLAFVVQREGEAVLWTQLPGEDAEQLIELEGSVVGLRWSPDGERIALVAQEDGASRVILVDVESGEMLVHADNGRAKRSPAWDSRGRKLLFAERHASWQIEELDVERGSQRTISAPGYGQVATSPDGQQRYVSRQVGKGDIELMRAQDNAGDEEALTPIRLRGSRHWPRVADAHWAVIDGEVIYLEWDASGSRARLMRRDLETGAVRAGPVVLSVDPGSQLAVAADGQSVILARRTREARNPLTLAGGGPAIMQVLPRNRGPVSLSAVPDPAPR